MSDTLSVADTGDDANLDPRVSYRKPVSRDGFVDAAWWPRSRALTAELPGLLTGLWTMGRNINRVNYSSLAWDPAPRTIEISGHKVRLGGFTTADPLSVRLSDAWGVERIDILIIAPDTQPALAARIMALAGHSGSRLRAAEILRDAAGPDRVHT